MPPSQPIAGFTPIRPNPFIVGNPVRDQKMFFGREAEFELVLKRFKHSDHGGLLVFCGERRSGKTSILFQILDGRLGDEFIPVLIDMQAMAVESENEFLSRVATEIHQRLGASSSAPDFSARTNAARLFQDFVRDLLQQHPNRKLILLIDEYELFEDKIEAGVLTQNTLNTFSSMMEQLRTFFVFTGSQHLEQRKKDYWRILGKSEYRRISFLQPKDAIQLIEQPVLGRVHYGDGVIESILRLSAGQPFYTQAICQNLVDQLNERKTNLAELAVLDAVVQQIVESPFPQMIFLWSTLRQAHKLTLSLLAQVLHSPGQFATAKQLGSAIGAGKYPLNLSLPELSTALEELFQEELLIKNDQREPGYAFRMDLWRLWILRMHSVWQVMREEGLATRSQRSRRRLPLILAGAGVLAIVVLVTQLFRDRASTSSDSAEHSPAGVATAQLELQVEPSQTSIQLDGNPVGLGSFQGRVAAGEHAVLLTAPGYADSSFAVSALADERIDRSVQLRSLFGSLRIDSDPPGAQLWLDGEALGKAPFTRVGVGVASAHRIVARLSGFQDAEQSVQLLADKLTRVTVRLTRGMSELSVLSTPSDAEVLVDGNPRGRTPLRLSDLGQESHRFGVQMAGYVSRDTTLQLEAGQAELRWTLRREPPGILVVIGDLPARIYVDDKLVAMNLQNSGNQELRPGKHEIEVVLADGQSQRRSVEIRSGERLVYDFTRQTLEPSNQAPE